MRSRALSGFLDLQHRLQRPVASRATGAVGHGEELGPELRQLRARRGELFRALRRRGRKELDGEDGSGAASHFLPGSSKADSAQEMMLYRIAPPTADQKPAT